MSRIKSLLAIGTLLNGSYDVTEKFTHNRATLIGDTCEMLFDYCLPFNLPFLLLWVKRGKCSVAHSLFTCAWLSCCLSRLLWPPTQLTPQLADDLPNANMTISRCTIQRSLISTNIFSHVPKGGKGDLNSRPLLLLLLLSSVIELGKASSLWNTFARGHWHQIGNKSVLYGNLYCWKHLGL